MLYMNFKWRIVTGSNFVNIWTITVSFPIFFKIEHTANYVYPSHFFFHLTKYSQSIFPFSQSVFIAFAIFNFSEMKQYCNNYPVFYTEVFSGIFWPNIKL